MPEAIFSTPLHFFISIDNVSIQNICMLCAVHHWFDIRPSAEHHARPRPDPLDRISMTLVDVVVSVLHCYHMHIRPVSICPVVLLHLPLLPHLSIENNTHNQMVAIRYEREHISRYSVSRVAYILIFSHFKHTSAHTYSRGFNIRWLDEH